MFVPVPVQRVRVALADPALVARAVPGLQQDAGSEPVAGRLKVRIGSHSITYRGTLRVSARDDGSYAVEGDAAESRGTGSVKLALTLRLRGTDEGSALVFDGTASADGRVTELPPEAVHTAVIRLLNRFAENLAAEAPEPTAPESLATEDFSPLATGDFDAAPDADDAPVPPPAESAEPAEPAEAGEAPEARPAGPAPVFDDEIPPSALDPLADEEDEDDEPPVSEDFTEPAEPPAEAAHARRTMIGRSAEEVDHAPPRGRYAPVPAPLTVAAGPALRWAAPAAALVVASAIIVGRALRRRR